MRHSKKRKGARLGQHFLAASWPAAKLVSSLRIAPDEAILEIGPGKGALTRELLKSGNRMIAVEKDGSLVEKLMADLHFELRSGQLTLLQEDIRNFTPENLGRYVVAANIPYYITGEIIRHFLTAKEQPRAMALLVQKEVAQRIVSTKESILSLSVKAYGTPRIVAKIGKGNFKPPPSVDSAILLINDISRNFFEEVDEKTFFDIVRAGFSSKRKLLSSNLSHFGKERVSRALENAGIAAKARAEEVSLQQWRELVKNLA